MPSLHHFSGSLDTYGRGICVVRMRSAPPALVSTSLKVSLMSMVGVVNAMTLSWQLKVGLFVQYLLSIVGFYLSLQ